MLYRKFANRLEEFLNNEPRKILLVNGARQIGKSYIIRYPTVQELCRDKLEGRQGRTGHLSVGKK